MKSGNSNIYWFKDRVLEIPREILVQKLISVINSVPQIKPDTFRLGREMAGVVCDVSSMVLKTAILLRSTDEDTEKRAEYDDKAQKLKDKGFLCFPVYANSIMFSPQNLAKQLKFEIFAHMKGKVLNK